MSYYILEHVFFLYLLYCIFRALCPPRLLSHQWQDPPQCWWSFLTFPLWTLFDLGLNDNLFILLSVLLDLLWFPSVSQHSCWGSLVPWRCDCLLVALSCQTSFGCFESCVQVCSATLSEFLESVSMVLMGPVLTRGQQAPPPILRPSPDAWSSTAYLSHFLTMSVILFACFLR